ncbi:MAG TPA: ATP-binding protein [Pyrinomonadaceae bacterium]|nr:ATP-binding protein [Pyrinomonadaceae bacterium]
MTRRKPFLTYTCLCAIPLLLLAGLNYWNGLRSVDSTAGAIVQNDLNAFNVSVDAELRARKSDVLRLSMMRDVQDIVSDKERVDVYPQGMYLTLKTLPLMREFESLTIFTRDRHAFVFRRGESEWTTTGNYHGAEFTEPDPHVWETQGNVTLERLDSAGKTNEYSAPIHDEKGTSNIGAVIGILSLDNMFASAARGLESKSSQLMVMAVDRSGKIVYHSNRSLKDLQVNQALPGFNTIANAMTNNDSGVREFKSSAGSYLAAYSPLPQLNVAVAVARDRSAALSSAHRWGIAGLVLALLFAPVAAFLLEQHVQQRSKGIEQVSADVSAIAKGEFDRRILLESSDDFRSLADNINVVTDQLRAQIAREEETRQFESFMRLSAMLTHDLKNAIEGLSLTVGNMERHFDNPQFRVDALKGLTSATNKLKALVARLSRPMTSLSGEHKRPTNVDLIPIIQRVVAITAEPQRSKHSIVTKLPSSLYALADAARVEEVLENLVLNALEAMTEKGGTLTIEAGQTANGAPMFAVSDTGRGMSRQFIDTRLFRPFATTKRTGIGLGLYTCREVIRASGGTIEVDSVEGAGTTFRVVLPSIPHDRRN